MKVYSFLTWRVTDKNKKTVLYAIDAHGSPALRPVQKAATVVVQKQE